LLKELDMQAKICSLLTLNTYLFEDIQFGEVNEPNILRLMKDAKRVHKMAGKEFILVLPGYTFYIFRRGKSNYRLVDMSLK